MDNKTSTTSPTDTAMLLAGIAAAVVSVVYSLKHVKKSKCCAGFFSCEQEPTVLAEQPIETPEILNQTNV